MVTQTNQKIKQRLIIGKALKHSDLNSNRRKFIINRLFCVHLWFFMLKILILMCMECENIILDFCKKIEKNNKKNYIIETNNIIKVYSSLIYFQ